MESKKEQYRFKTNINCGGCIASVKPHLDGKEGICSWSVDTANADKVLTVEAEGMSEQEVADVVRKAGYKAEPMAA